MCFNKDSSSLLIFCHFSEKCDYLFGLGEKFGQLFWASIAVECYQNRPGYIPVVKTVCKNTFQKFDDTQCEADRTERCKLTRRQGVVLTRTF